MPIAPSRTNTAGGSSSVARAVSRSPSSDTIAWRVHVAVEGRTLRDASLKPTRPVSVSASQGPRFRHPFLLGSNAPNIRGADSKGTLGVSRPSTNAFDPHVSDSSLAMIPSSLGGSPLSLQRSASQHSSMLKVHMRADGQLAVRGESRVWR